jgi:hypothetical protein
MRKRKFSLERLGKIGRSSKPSNGVNEVISPDTGRKSALVLSREGGNEARDSSFHRNE